MKSTLRLFNPYLQKLTFAAPLLVALALTSPLSAQRPAPPNRVPVSPDVPSLQKVVTVMVEMSGDAAGKTYAAALKTAQAAADKAINTALKSPKSKASQSVLKTTATKQVQISARDAAAVAARVKELDTAQRAVEQQLKGGNINARSLYRMQRAYNGLVVQVRPDRISEILKVPGVKAVHPMIPKQRSSTFSDIDFTNTRPVWAKPPFGIHGENIKVAVIDSGLDYIHANFGGPGSGGYALVTDHTVAPNSFFPTPKVPGGFDFAGDNYNANVPGNDVPNPDPDPFDCGGAGSSGGHGTATASLVGGYGVTNAGFTYAGSYDAANPSIAGLTIPPGYAPNAKLYPLRVFGCNGSTNLTEAAIEWAMDPNGDGNFSDRVDVINMSLGSNNGYADDTSAVASSIAASIGINVCSAAGNAGDTFYIHSSPAAASNTLGVAASFNDQNGFIADAHVIPNTPGAGTPNPPPPGAAAGRYFGIYGSGSPHTAALTANVVYARPANGSNGTAGVPLTNAAQMAGNICLIDRGVTTFLDKVQRAFAAGAVGVIVNNFTQPGVPPIVMSTPGQPAIPAIMISRADRDIINAAAAFDATTGVAANPCNVTMGDEPLTTIPFPTNGAGSAAGAGSPDTLPTYTSRGPRLPDSAIKPDVTAPAEVTAVAAHNSGNGFQNFNGTSSATPHVAGIMALMKQLHPSWTVQELNALVCGTATHDLTTTVAGATKIGVGRIGAGRVNVGKAGDAGVAAYNGSDPGAVGVSFGIVDVPVDGSRSLTKTVKVTNKSLASVTYNLTLQNLVNATGASFSLGSASITVGAGATGTFNVTYSVPSGAALRHERDPSTSTVQADAVFGGAFRQFLTESNGYVVLTPTSGPEPVQRVALYAAPRPTSSMHATTTSVVPTAASGSFTINLSGAGFNTGATTTDETAMMKAFELQYISPLANSPSAPTDANVIKYVGVTSDWASRSAADRANGLTTVTWGIEAFGEAAEPWASSSDKQILLDFDFDSVVDATIFLTALNNLNSPTARTNVYYVGYVDDAGLYGPAGNGYFWDHMTNGIVPNLSFNPNNTTARDVNTFNNSAVHIPVDFIVGTGATAFNYQVVTFDRNGGLVDQTPVLFFDVAAPGIDTTPAAQFEPFVFTDVPATTVTANYNGTNIQNNGSLGVLLLHRHNGNGNRADVVLLRKPTISSFSPTSGPVGTTVTITGANFNAGTVVKFFNNQTATSTVLTPNTIIATVPPGAVTGPITVSNAAGSSQSPGNFTVLP